MLKFNYYQLQPSRWFALLSRAMKTIKMQWELHKWRCALSGYLLIQSHWEFGLQPKHRWQSWRISRSDIANYTESIDVRARTHRIYLMTGLSRDIDPDTGNKSAPFHPGYILRGRSRRSWKRAFRSRCVLRDLSFLSPADRVGFANVNWLVNLHNA